MKEIHRLTFLFVLALLASCANSPEASDREEQAVEIAIDEKFAAVLTLQARVAVLNLVMAEEGAFDSPALTIDFEIFGSRDADITGLSNQLLENYVIASREVTSDGYTVLEFTTRPRSIELSADLHIEWVTEIANMADSFGCVFSTWTIKDTVSGMQWTSKVVDNSSRLTSP